MTYNLDWLKQKIQSEPKTRYLFFYGHRKNNSSAVQSTCLSQWYDSPFTVSGKTYLTAEHWMMAQKALLFDDAESLKKIMAATTPGEAKELGRRVKNFNEETWVAHRFGLVVSGNVHKFGKNPDLKEFLLNTEDRVLVEASPVDVIWGVGLSLTDMRVDKPNQWRGLNLLGFALMEVRDILKKQ